MNDTTVRAAIEAARRNEPQMLVHVCDIPAPPFKVKARGLARLFGELGNRT